MVLDSYSPPQLGNLSIDGTLEINTTLPLTLRAGYIRVRGQLLAGTPTAPLTADGIFITLAGGASAPLVPANGPEGTKVLFVDGGTLSMVGTGPHYRAHKVTASVVPAPAGTRTRLLLDPPLTRAVPGDRVRFFCTMVDFSLLRVCCGDVVFTHRYQCSMPCVACSVCVVFCITFCVCTEAGSIATAFPSQLVLASSTFNPYRLDLVHLSSDLPGGGESPSAVFTRVRAVVRQPQ